MNFLEEGLRGEVYVREEGSPKTDLPREIREILFFNI